MKKRRQIKEWFEQYGFAVIILTLYSIVLPALAYFACVTTTHGACPV